MSPLDTASLGTSPPPAHLHNLLSTLGPLSEDSHETAAKGDTAEGEELDLEAGVAHLGVEHELVGQQLDETGVDQDAGADGVEDTIDDKRGGAARLEGLADTQARSDRDRC